MNDTEITETAQSMIVWRTKQNKGTGIAYTWPAMSCIVTISCGSSLLPSVCLSSPASLLLISPRSGSIADMKLSVYFVSVSQQMHILTKHQLRYARPPRELDVLEAAFIVYVIAWAAVAQHAECSSLGLVILQQPPLVYGPWPSALRPGAARARLRKGHHALRSLS
eukprot:scaffold1058_cov362-Prasinococcus_capsulatus_cf.AAC.12